MNLNQIKELTEVDEASKNEWFSTMASTQKELGLEFGKWPESANAYCVAQLMAKHRGADESSKARRLKVAKLGSNASQRRQDQVDRGPEGSTTSSVAGLLKDLGV